MWREVLIAAAAAASPANPAVQQQFDAASALLDRQQWAEAAKAYAALDAQLPNASRRSRAVVRLREGIALAHLSRRDAALDLITTALADLPAGDASLAQDRFDGWMALGGARMSLFDAAGALDAYAAAAAAAPDDVARIAAASAQARVSTTIDPKAALAAAARAQAAFDALGPAGQDKKTKGYLLALRGRALLNDGQAAAAKKTLEASVAALGGLRPKVTASDIEIRSDLAIASLLSHDLNGAQQYLAYSGTGTLEEGFARAADTTLPDCTGAPGLRPDDKVVVEFGIAADGTVDYATPVFASAPGPAAMDYARAVSTWSWSADRLAKVPELFRYMTRLELRCSTAHRAPTTAALMAAQTARWLRTQDAGDFPTGDVAAARLAAARAELAKAADDRSLRIAPALFTVAHSNVAPEAERKAAAERLRDIVLANRPPPPIAGAVALLPLLADAGSQHAWQRARPAAIALVARPEIVADADAVNLLRLRIADEDLGHRQPQAAEPLITAAVADKRLPDDDVLRVAALLRLSAIRMTQGDLAAARAAYEQTHLSDAECALVDATPAVARRAGSAADYPGDAVRWGISGWAETEFDISGAGRAVGVRTIISYPPFIFDKPVEDIFAHYLFTQSYRPNGGAGCSGYRASQGFRVVR